MMADPKRLLGGYATDSLTQAERETLLRAALDDQELFDALVEEEGLRELLSDAAARQKVLEALEQATRWERWFGWLRRPATVTDLLAVAAVVIVAVVAHQVYRATSSERSVETAARPGMRALPQASLDRLAALPSKAETPSAEIALETGLAAAPERLRPGDLVAIRLTVKQPSRVVLLQVGPDGSAGQAWPPGDAPPGLLAPTARETTAIRHVRVKASNAPGTNRLRLVAAPTDLDLVALPPSDINRVASRLALVDLTFVTERP